MIAEIGIHGVQAWRCELQPIISVERNYMKHFAMPSAMSASPANSFPLLEQQTLVVGPNAVFTLVLLGALIALAQSSAIAPFIYTLF